VHGISDSHSLFRFRRNSLGHRNGAYLRFDNGTPPRRRSRPEAFAWPLLERVHPRGSSDRARKEIASGSSCWSTGTTGRSVLICFMACPGAHFGRLKGSSFSRMRHLFQTFKNTTFNNISRMTPRIWSWSGYIAKTKSSNVVSAKPRRLSTFKKVSEILRIPQEWTNRQCHSVLTPFSLRPPAQRDRLPHSGRQSERAGTDDPLPARPKAGGSGARRQQNQAAAKAVA
jgi:hypothetical protein